MVFVRKACKQWNRILELQGRSQDSVKGGSNSSIELPKAGVSH